jgi:hypothetical protein
MFTVLDEEAVGAQMRVIQRDMPRYKAILALPAESAQRLLDRLQTVRVPLTCQFRRGTDKFHQRSDNLSLHPYLRRFSMGLLIKLAHESGLYPKCLIQRDIQLIGHHPFGGGGFGDVWRGLMKGHLVAVKVLRMFEESDVPQLLKVNGGIYCDHSTSKITSNYCRDFHTKR